MKVEDTYIVQIWVGLRAGYGDYYFNVHDVYDICDKWINSKKDCVTVTVTTPEITYILGDE